MCSSITVISLTHTHTYVGGCGVHVGVAIKLACGSGVHLDQGDAALAPHGLRLSEREEGAEEQVDDSL